MAPGLFPIVICEATAQLAADAVRSVNIEVDNPFFINAIGRSSDDNIQDDRRRLSRGRARDGLSGDGA